MGKKTTAALILAAILIVIGIILAHKSLLPSPVGQQHPPSELPKLAQPSRSGALPPTNLPLDRESARIPPQAPRTQPEHKNTLSPYQEDSDVLRELRRLGDLYRRKDKMSDEELQALWSDSLDLASQRSKNPRLTADAIWLLSGLGMLLRARNTLSQEELSAQCDFLKGLAGDNTQPALVRRLAISAIGDLRITAAIPTVSSVLSDPGNWNLPDIARSASISLVQLSPTQAIEQVSLVLSGTTNSAVFGSAAYALGQTRMPQAISALVANRDRLDDNLSVDNAINNMSDVITNILTEATHSQIFSAIEATRSMWKEEQQQQYIPLLLQMIKDPQNPIKARRAALKRLDGQAAAMPFAAGSGLRSQILELVADDPQFEAESQALRSANSFKVLAPVSVEPNKSHSDNKR